MRLDRELLCLAGCVMSMLFGGAGCGADIATLMGSGTRASEMRQLDPFTRIEIRGAADTDVSVGQPQSVQIEADDNILPIIESYVSNGTLVITSKGRYRPRTPVLVHIIVPELNGVSVPGSGTVAAKGIKSSDFSIDISGSGNVMVVGSASSVSVGLSGSGNVDARRLTTARGEVRLSGSGNVQVNSTESLKVHLSGSGNVSYEGKPRTEAHVTGSGSVHGL
jgi:hypothetical protein